MKNEKLKVKNRSHFLLLVLNFFMRILGVFLVLGIALPAQAPATQPSAQPPAELAIRIVSPEQDSYVSGVTKLKAEVLPKMLASRVAQILFLTENGYTLVRP